jgi:hypothetical protein
MLKKILLFICPLVCSCQESPSYWRISNIYKEDGIQLRGITALKMQEIYNQDMHFKKDKSILKFDLPTPKNVALDTLKSLSNKRFDNDFFIGELVGKLVDSIYFKGIEKDKFKIKIINNYTTDEDKRTVFEFEQISEKEYFDDIKKTQLRQEVSDAKISEFLKNYKLDNSWSKNDFQSTKNVNLESVDRKIFKIEIPENFEVKAVSKLYNNTFDKLKVGSAHDNHIHYELINSKLKDNLAKEAEFFIVNRDQDKFDLEKYLSLKPNYHVLQKDKNSFTAIEVFYDEEVNTVKIIEMISFSHFYKDGNHLILFCSDSVKSENDFDLAKLHYRLKTLLKLK